MESPAAYAPSRHDDHELPYREPLSPWTRRVLLATVVFFHVGGGWALTQIEPPHIVVGDAPPMEVRMVSAEQPSPNINVPPPEDTPPPEPPPELDSMIQPPPPDLPPPVFPVEAPPPPPPKPKPPPPKPRPPVPAQTATPSEQPPSSAPPSAPSAPTAPAGPVTVQASQVSFRVRPNPVYPSGARRRNEQGTATFRVVVDTAGRPTSVTLSASSGHPALDEAALAAVKAAQFNPYVQGGVARSIVVDVPIRFVLQ